jgi:hypothetical protein
MIVIVGAGAYLYHSEHSKAPSKPAVATTPATTSTQSYLVVKELDIRFKLSSTISDAYYQVKPNTTKNGKPVIVLYLHSLDQYPNCAPAKNPDGVALIGTYQPGATDPVFGGYSTAYPNAPLIGGLHYYIANEQYECSGNTSANLTGIGAAFTAAYTSIETYSQSR